MLFRLLLSKKVLILVHVFLPIFFYQNVYDLIYIKFAKYIFQENIYLHKLENHKIYKNLAYFPRVYDSSNAPFLFLQKVWKQIFTRAVKKCCFSYIIELSRLLLF